MPEQLVSAGTAVTLLVGVIISAVYVRYMWGALARAVRTRDEVDSGQDRYQHSLIGALIAVVGSALAISAFGLGPALLYLGPGLALLSAIAVARCLRTEYVDE
jgi:small-conductance mechanosensitive channel